MSQINIVQKTMALLTQITISNDTYNQYMCGNPL